jgi:hypothetical protein
MKAAGFYQCGWTHKGLSRWDQAFPSKIQKAYDVYKKKLHDLHRWLP